MLALVFWEESPGISLRAREAPSYVKIVPAGPRRSLGGGMTAFGVNGACFGGAPSFLLSSSKAMQAGTRAAHAGAKATQFGTGAAQ